MINRRKKENMARNVKLSIMKHSRILNDFQQLFTNTVHFPLLLSVHARGEFLFYTYMLLHLLP